MHFEKLGCYNTEIKPCLIMWVLSSFLYGTKCHFFRTMVHNAAAWNTHTHTHALRKVQGYEYMDKIRTKRSAME